MGHPVAGITQPQTSSSSTQERPSSRDTKNETVESIRENSIGTDKESIRGKTLLEGAICLGETDEVRRLIKENLFPLGPFLEIATKLDNKTIPVLLEQEISRRKLYTENNIEALTQCLNEGGSPNYIATDGVTLLHYCISSKQDDSVKLLLEKGANPNQVGQDGKLPLRCAIESNNVVAFELLLDHNAKTEHPFYENDGMALCNLIIAHHRIEMLRILNTKLNEELQAETSRKEEASEEEDFHFNPREYCKSKDPTEQAREIESIHQYLSTRLAQEEAKSQI